MKRRRFLNNMLGASLVSMTPASMQAAASGRADHDLEESTATGVLGNHGEGIAENPNGEKNGTEERDPTGCYYSPPGEYIKDQTFVFTDGWWHLFSISGTQGYYLGYTGNEETFSWSISKNLVDWEFRGHVIHPSLRDGTYDQHQVWAPFCMKANDQFYMFYTGIVHPHRPMEYRRIGHDHPAIFKGHSETQGLAVSTDLTDWKKVDDPVKGLGIPGRDSNVVRDEDNKRWLLYSTGRSQMVDGERKYEVYVSESTDLLNWKFIGLCALFPRLDITRNYGYTVDSWDRFKNWAGTTESMVIRWHPLNKKWIMMGNWQYALSDNPTDFTQSEVHYYDNRFEGKRVDLGFACEMVEYNNKLYRSATLGDRDYWKLVFSEVEWVKGGTFRIVKPGKYNKLYT